MRALPLLLLLLLAPPASANMSDPYTPGTISSEPSVALKGLRVVSETLTFDLRALNRDRLAATNGIVEAVYQIDNTGEARVVPLDFLALGHGVDSTQVWLDDQPVAWTRLDSVVTPLSWRSQDRSGLREGDLRFRPEMDAPTTYDSLGSPIYDASGYRFSVALSPGRHVIRVRYSASPTANDVDSHPNVLRRFPYSLAPARRWDGFGHLEVVVLAPDGWDSFATLPLRADGEGRKVGTFTGVPADVVEVSVRPPASPMRAPIQYGGTLLALGLIVFFGWFSGWLVGGTSKSVWLALPGSILGGILAWVVLAISAFITFGMGDSASNDTTLITMLFWGPLALIVGSVVAQMLAVRVARRVRAGLSVGGSRGEPG